MDFSEKKLRYNNFSSFLKEKFGCKVYKLPLDAGFSCPNREKGTPCIYCDPCGSGTGASYKNIALENQISQYIERFRNKYKAQKFIAYFQAFTNTYKPIGELKMIYDVPARFDEVIGISIGTRPDCVDEEKIALISSYTEKNYVWMEYGMQSANDKTLLKINRGHTYSDLKRAVDMTKSIGEKINICLHVILGLPGETYNDMMRTADEVASLGINGVKIHLLHIVKGSLLEQMYLDGEIDIMDEQTYISTVCDFLEKMPPEMLIQRLTGERHPDILVSPKWCLEKTRVLHEINNELIRRNSYQGKKWDR